MNNGSALCKKRNLTKTHFDDDCILDFLEKIKEQYIDFKTKFHMNEELTKELKKKNKDLEKSVERLQNDLNSNKKRRKTDSFNESELDVSNLFNCGAVLAEKSTDDLNIALNTQRQFQNIFLSTSPNNQKEKDFAKNLKVPIKANSSFVKHKSLRIKKSQQNNENTEPLSSWQSKNKFCNAIKTYPSDSDEENYHNIFQKAEMENKKISRLSLKASKNKLKQSRLNFDIVKNDSMDANSDETFCDEIIDASPLRKNSSIDDKLDKEDFFNFSSKLNTKSISNNNIKKEPIIQQKIIVTPIPNEANISDFEGIDKFDSSSLIILPNETEDIITLNDNESINIESANLLHDILNEKFDDLNYMRKIENDRIKKIQNRHKITEESNSVKCDKQTLTGRVSKNLQTNLSIKLEKMENKNQIGCKECLSYLSYLKKVMGNKLTDEEINQRLRNCTKHKGPTDINPTPEGFWDPFIRSLPANDPRNETLIDTRFRDRKVNKKK